MFCGVAFPHRIMDRFDDPNIARDAELVPDHLHDLVVTDEQRAAVVKDRPLVNPNPKFPTANPAPERDKKAMADGRMERNKRNF